MTTTPETLLKNLVDAAHCKSETTSTFAEALAAATDFLYPEFDNAQALREGWNLFDVAGYWVLKRIDPSDYPGIGYDMPKFDSDAAAIIHVAHLASKGSAYHLQALELIGTDV